MADRSHDLQAEAEAGLLILDDMDRGDLSNETRDAVRRWYEDVVRGRL